MENFIAYLKELWFVEFFSFGVFFLIIFLGMRHTFKGGILAQTRKSILLAILGVAIVTLVAYPLSQKNSQPEYQEYSLENFGGTIKSTTLKSANIKIPFKEALNWGYKATLLYNDKFVIVYKQTKQTPGFQYSLKKIPENYKTSKLDQTLIIMKKGY